MVTNNIAFKDKRYRVKLREHIAKKWGLKRDELWAYKKKDEKGFLEAGMFMIEYAGKVRCAGLFDLDFIRMEKKHVSGVGWVRTKRDAFRKEMDELYGEKMRKMKRDVEVCKMLWMMMEQRERGLKAGDIVRCYTGKKGVWKFVGFGQLREAEMLGRNRKKLVLSSGQPYRSALWEAAQLAMILECDLVKTTGSGGKIDAAEVECPGDSSIYYKVEDWDM